MIRAIIPTWSRWLAFMLAAMLATLTLAGCNPEHFKTKAAQVPELVFTAPSAPQTFNFTQNQSAYTVFGYITEGLITENGLTGAVEPALAKSWTISPDKLRIVFTLRPGLKWSDGTPLTINDVMFSYRDVYFNDKIPTDVRDGLRIGTSRTLPTVKQLDQRRVEFSVPEPFAPFLRFVGELPILPAHALQKSVHTIGPDGNPEFISTWDTGTDVRKIISNGPYRMVSYAPNQRVIFRRNPYYWRKDAQGNPQPYIDRIVLQIIASTDNQLISFRSRQLDDLDVKSEAFGLLKQEEQRGHFKIYNGGPESTTTFVTFNLNKARDVKNQPFVDPIKSRWFNNVAFRQAVAYAINRQVMVDNIFRGLATLQNSPIYLNNPYYLSPKKGLKVYDYNPEKAKQQLLVAGFKYNSQGQLLDADGNRVEFTMLVKAEEKNRVDMAIQVQQDLAKIGIKADLQQLAFNVVLPRLLQRRWECYVGKFGSGGIDPNSGSNVWMSTGGSHQFNQGPQPGEPPIKGWEVSDWEKEVDRLFIEGARELNEGKRKKIYDKFQQVTQEQLPFIYLVNPLTFEAVRDRVQGVKFSTLAGSAFWNLYELKVTQE